MSGCEICGAPHGVKDYGEVPDFFLKTNYLITECPDCGVKKTNPFPEDIAALYEVQSYNKMQNRLFRYCKGILIRREIGRIVRHTGNRRFLDVGSGAGEFSAELLRKGYDTAAADSAPERPVYLKDALEIPYVKFSYEDYEVADPGVMKGRTVVLRHVLEHITDPARFLKKFVEGGADYFYIAVPNTDCRERRVFGKYYSTWYLPYHLWHFNRSSLSRLFQKTGIELIASGYDTIPTIVMHMYFYMRAKNYPQIIRNVFIPYGATLVLTSPLNLCFPDNVVWIVGKRIKG